MSEITAETVTVAPVVPVGIDTEDTTGGDTSAVAPKAAIAVTTLTTVTALTAAIAAAEWRRAARNNDGEDSRTIRTPCTTVTFAVKSNLVRSD